MKSRGFTLTEILGVIVVISLLLILVMPTVINRINTYKDESSNSEKALIFNATDLYLDENKEDYPDTPGNIYCVTIKQLLDNGKLVDPVKKAVEDGNYSDDTTIKIAISSNGVRTHTLGPAKDCKVNVTNDIVIVVTKEKIWAKAKTVTIYYPKLDGNYNNEYRIDGGSWQTWNGPLTLTKNSTVEARAVGKTIINKTKKVNKIDPIAPVVSVSKGSWNSNGQQALNFVLKDMDSGIDGYYLSVTNSQPTINSSAWTKYSLPAYGGTGTVSISKPLGTYYMFVKDKAGNVNSVSVSVTDTVAPTCGLTTSGTLGSNSWYKSNVTVSFASKSDAESGLNGFGMSTSSTPIYNGSSSLVQSGDTKGTVYYGYVKDFAGNINKCTTTVKKDTVGPSISTTNSGGGKWTNQDVVITANASDGTSGMNNVTYSYSSDGSSPASDWDAGATPTSVRGTWRATRNNTVYIVGTDNAGNKTIKNAGEVKIDKIKPYVNLSFEWTTLKKGWETLNECYSTNNKGGDKTCRINLSISRFGTWRWETTKTGTDEGGSGINRLQYKWDHNGNAPRYDWTDSAKAEEDNWSWKVESGTPNKATYLNYSMRYIDNAGNVGPVLTVHFQLSYTD